MKKTYMTPSIFVMELKAEQMLAVSGIKVADSNDSGVDGSAVWTNKKGWSSENFMPGNEENYME